MQKEKSVDEITEEAIKHGGCLAIIYFDLHANSKEAVKEIMVGFIGKLTKEEGVIYALGEIDEPLEKDGLFSTWAEVKLLASNFRTLVKIAIQYSPIGFDILRPHELKLSLGEAQAALLDVSQASHEFTKVIMERVLSEEEKKEYANKLAKRIELGRMLINKKKDG